ncbi:uncharacterized protein MELLADRAFT_108044 [Melampsora larici-populina 98AG31]|uniref:Uncharacterized protein n=1 Tax=Melampsora larici-populina (strain 98AG31 / pathotype 3-4-7) TaxID=747676 RepID=F4RRS5_MELLP|nr:uncharacterized protein MELLADRAFT_108044 [Melampsora larici-populina 98AG31]EGG04904.1 hypothetical protein MELLADRAFT_108044 [Melampsora larici-populina 98AG31]
MFSDQWHVILKSSINFYEKSLKLILFFCKIPGKTRQLVEEGGHSIGDVVRQINGVPDGNQMMVDHAMNNVESSGPQPVGVPKAYRFKTIVIRPTPRYRPAIGVPYGFQQPTEDLRPARLPTYKIPGAGAVYLHNPPGDVRYGYDHQPIQFNRQQVDPRFQAVGGPNPFQLNQGQLNEVNMRNQMLAEIGPNGQQIINNIRQKVKTTMESTQFRESKSNLNPNHGQQVNPSNPAAQGQPQALTEAQTTRKGEGKSPLGVKNANRKVANKNKDKVLTKPNRVDYKHFQPIKNVHESIQPGYKSIVNEFSNAEDDAIYPNLAQLYKRSKMLQNAPQTQENQVMLGQLNTVINERLLRPLDIEDGVLSRKFKPNLLNLLKSRRKLDFRSPRTLKRKKAKYYILNTLIEQEMRQPIDTPMPLWDLSESVGSTTAGDKLKSNEEVNSQLKEKNVGPSFNHDAATKKFQRIPTFDLNKEPDEFEDK